ncbi:INTEGRAL MEMBRANE PROTEIN (Rhomboid family) [Acidisarcina polymorpha]|uniref:INTEGRAL MEMBRANE PROTEIN (Rhomboid family) n=1 Tax=Acidisarcina polymorpha TaxID=2211140 RepID=A0A2Z5FXZ9_9BACT|nr:hypothetical protein [Acidisarcina polymorpha]AXC11600.1 INTEGRAL MEMBRANE PROTEIN (Rhomboid family) [Acidisarcina polymorpha]
MSEQSIKHQGIKHQGIEHQGLNHQGVAVKWPDFIRPMHYGSVPDVDARYWAVMAMASVLGCNTGDDCSYYFGWNHWIGLGPLALIFFAVLFGERRSSVRSQVWYWGAVIVLRTAATNLADLATHTFALPYLQVIRGLAVLQALVVWPVAPRLLAAASDSKGRPATGGWYWLSLLTAGTLGTAIGDWVADELHLSTGYGTLLLTAIFGLVLALGRRDGWTTKAAYWTAVIALRAAGTTAGDWLAFREDPGLHNGLNLGLPLSTAVSGAMFLGCLFAWRARKRGAFRN